MRPTVKQPDAECVWRTWRAHVRGGKLAHPGEERISRVIVNEGSPPLAVVYDSWQEWRDERLRERLEPLPPLPAVVPKTYPCPLCWGQRVIFMPAANGEGLVGRACESCDGQGLVHYE